MPSIRVAAIVQATLPHRLDIEVPAIRGIAEHVTLRLGRVLPRAVTSIPDRMELHRVYLLREVGAVAADSIEANVGFWHSLVGVIPEGVGMRHGMSALKCHLLPRLVTPPTNLVMNGNAG